MNTWKPLLILSLLLIAGCSDDNGLEAELTFRMTYAGEPLVISQDYRYPDGKLMQITRVSFYVSDLTFIDGASSVNVRPVDFINLSSSHLSENSATTGFKYFSEKIDLDAIDEVSFNIGLTEDQNTKVPGDFSTNHPQSKPGEYWLAWDSFIFAKIEGWIDLDGDDDPETGMALHLGSDAVMREISLNAVGLGEKLVIEFDIAKAFESETIYDIEGNHALHSLSQLPAAEELADNLSKSITIKTDR